MLETDLNDGPPTTTFPSRQRPRRGAPSLSAAFVVLVLLASALAPWLAPEDPLAQNLARNLEGPSLAHPLGLDKLGRDVLSRLMYGARVSVEVGILSVALSLLVGIAVGGLAGLGGRRTDFAITSMIDILMAFPGLLLAIAVSAVESNRRRVIAEEARAESEAVSSFLSGILGAADPLAEGRDVEVLERVA